MATSKKKAVIKTAKKTVKTKTKVKAKTTSKVKKSVVKKATPTLKKKTATRTKTQASVIKKIEKVIKAKPVKVKPTGLAVGAEIEMAFHGAGVTSLEKHIISNFDAKHIWITTENSKGEFYKFDRKTGKCLNDNTFGGFSRTILPQ